MNGEIIADGLEFPEGPVWLDGTIWFTEILGGHVSRWTPGAGVERVDDRTTAEDAEQGLLACAAYGELVGVPDPGLAMQAVPMQPEGPGTPLAAAIPPLNLPS